MSNNDDYIRVSNVLHAANDNGLLTADDFREALLALQRILNQAEEAEKSGKMFGT